MRNSLIGQFPKFLLTSCYFIPDVRYNISNSVDAQKGYIITANDERKVSMIVHVLRKWIFSLCTFLCVQSIHWVIFTHTYFCNDHWSASIRALKLACVRILYDSLKLPKSPVWWSKNKEFSNGTYLTKSLGSK